MEEVETENAASNYVETASSHKTQPNIHVHSFCGIVICHSTYLVPRRLDLKRTISLLRMVSVRLNLRYHINESAV